MGLYLQVGNLVLSDGVKDSEGYTITEHPSLPEPEPDGYGGYQYAERTFKVYCHGSTSSATNYRTSVLRREAVKDKYLYFKHSTEGTLLSCRIVEGKCVEEEYTPTKRDVFGVLLTITLKTDPYWLGPWSTETSASSSVTTCASHFDIPDPGGEVDALLSIKCVPSTSGTMLAIGVKPDPSGSYDYLDDYSGSAESTALSGSASTTYTVTGTTADAISPATYDTSDNSGRHLLLARVNCSAVNYSSTYITGNTATAGNAITGSVVVNEQAIPCTSSAFVVYNMGDVSVPAGKIPDGYNTDVGWGPATVTASCTTLQYYMTFPVGPTTTWQTVYPGYGLLDEVKLYVVNLGSATDYVRVNLYGLSSSGALSGPILAASSQKAVAPDASGAWYTFSFAHTNFVSMPGTNYGIVPWSTYSSSLTTFLINTCGTYSSGNCYSTYPNSGLLSNYDFLFTCSIKQPLGFNTYNSILASQTSPSAGVQVDYVQRVPIDYGAILYTPSDSNTSLGLYYDGSTDTPYIANSDGIGYAVYDKCEVRKPLRCKPGVTNRVVLGIGQASEAVVGVDTLTYKTRPRYLSATGD